MRETQSPSGERTESRQGHVCVPEVDRSQEMGIAERGLVGLAGMAVPGFYYRYSPGTELLTVKWKWRFFLLSSMQVHLECDGHCHVLPFLLPFFYLLDAGSPRSSS